jgi:hypothetical protein
VIIVRLIEKKYTKPEVLTKMFHVEQFGNKLLLILVIIVISPLAHKLDIQLLLFKSLSERMLYIIVPRGTIPNNTIFGAGSDQFVTNMSIHTNQPLS